MSFEDELDFDAAFREIEQESNLVGIFGRPRERMSPADKQSQKVFTKRATAALSRLIDAPLATQPGKKAAPNRSFYFEGFDDETYIRVWASSAQRMRMLYGARVHFTADFDTVTLDYQDIAISSAFGVGRAFRYQHTNRTLEVGLNDARSHEIRQQMGLPIVHGQRHETEEHRRRGGPDITSYPASGFNVSSFLEAIDPIEAAFQRQDAEKNLIPQLERLNPFDLVDVSQPLPTDT